MKYLTKTIKPLLLLFTLYLVSACSSPNISDYSQTSPDFDVLSFFNGELEAKGVVIDRSGLVTRRFSVKMLGSLAEDELTLEEWFVFDDGEQTQRTWIISKNGDATYSGRAGDIMGTARGESNGMALHWDYEMDLQVDENIYRVVFDDWLYRIDEENVINRSVIKKWGFKVGEVILSIRKI
ncbi:DUF3833 domain-containing protein [Psychromonas antarctica]|jgi:hypothetical protein|uniref:DUF3833 domain-containing protein n=1 Tax=Psychromonas antarctica TaxID=67573 RepID=UPI001EE9A18B|nr:DUF3833 domain-containing protein [Psychromonas antarctica]MCG6202071.1 DUF3833 domain-containing protein [Psychromonas antarctica]